MRTELSTQKPHVLIIEPDAILADAYRAAFARARYQAAIARTAQSAIDAMDGQTPDCVVLEIQLPAHNGVEFLYELRSYAEWQRVPVVINTYTPRSEFVHMHNALQTLGVVHVLYKPQATLQQLLSTVREVIATEQKTNRALREAGQ